MKTINQTGFVFKMIGGNWVRADQFPHIRQDIGSIPVWWPTDTPERIPIDILSASLTSDTLKFLYSKKINNEFIKTNTAY